MMKLHKYNEGQDNKVRDYRWLRVSALSAVGGGIASAFAASQDPAKYSFPKDLGSGKLWPFFIQGALLTFGAMLIKSPLGQKIIGSVKDTKAQLEESKQIIEDTKAELKGKSDGPKQNPSIDKKA